MSVMFESVSIGKMELKNRFVHALGYGGIALECEWLQKLHLHKVKWDCSWKKQLRGHLLSTKALMELELDLLAPTVHDCNDSWFEVCTAIAKNTEDCMKHLIMNGPRSSNLMRKGLMDMKNLSVQSVKFHSPPEDWSVDTMVLVLECTMPSFLSRLIVSPPESKSVQDAERVVQCIQKHFTLEEFDAGLGGKDEFRK